MKNLAVIIGREGSKRIKNKNFKKFYGKSIVEWSINVAEKTNLFDKIIFSTDKDQKKIKNKKIKNYIYFKRPKKYSGDNASTNIAVNHSINWIKNNFTAPKYVCCIYACSPLIIYNDIINAYKILKSNKWNYVFSATNYNYPLERSFKINNDKSIKMNFPKNYSKKTQLFKTNYHDAGQFYWGKIDSWLNNKKFFDSNSTAYLIPSERVQDIDSLENWRNAEKIFKDLRK